MVDPSRMLDRFEIKHGEWHELLEEYVTTQDPVRRQQLDRLMRAHARLCWLLMGYQQGYKDGQKAGGER